jgi:adenylate cyclase class 2
MKEVEIKIKINNCEEIKKMFEKEGYVFSNPKKQEDLIFTDPKTAKSFDKFTSETNFVRIRKSDNEIKLTLKRPQTGELDCIEKELNIDDADTMHDILVYLGYIPVVEVNKIRSSAYKEPYTVCIDTVEDLGSFLEIEKIVSENSNSLSVQEELWNLLKKFNISKKDEVKNGYDTLLYRKNI